MSFFEKLFSSHEGPEEKWQHIILEALESAAFGMPQGETFFLPVKPYRKQLNNSCFFAAVLSIAKAAERPNAETALPNEKVLVKKAQEENLLSPSGAAKTTNRPALLKLKELLEGDLGLKLAASIIGSTDEKTYVDTIRRAISNKDILLISHPLKGDEKEIGMWLVLHGLKNEDNNIRWIVMNPEDGITNFIPSKDLTSLIVPKQEKGKNLYIAQIIVVKNPLKNNEPAANSPTFSPAR